MSLGMLLTLDLAGATGWAHDSDVPGVPVAGTFIAARIEAVEGGRAMGPMFSSLRAWLVKEITATKPVLIAFEQPIHVSAAKRDPRFQNMDVFRALNGLCAVAEEVAYTMRVPCIEREVGEIKAHFGGSRHATKEDMMARCRMFGWAHKNDHEADAMGLWSLVKSELDPKWAPQATPLFARARR